MSRRFPTIAASLSMFLATLSLLFWQVRTGHDPVLSGAQVAQVVAGSHGKALTSRSSGHGGGATQAKPGHHKATSPLHSKSSGGGKHHERESD